MHLDDMRGRVGAARVARLATLATGGAPHLVPFCFVLDGDALYSAVDSKPKRSRSLRRLENVERDPRLAVLVDHYEEDWSKLWWVRLEGTGRQLASGPRTERALALLVAKYAQYAGSRPEGPVLEILIERWSGWSAS
jgi:PPOX class probable F420-dependent enzyme